MQNLNVLKTLQTNYQEKFAKLLELQEELTLSHSDTLDSEEYMRAKDEWMAAGNKVRAYLENNMSI